jgi:nickel-type superoxide dismutase maturation protease
MSQWAYATLGGATRSTAWRTRSTKVEGVCIRLVVYLTVVLGLRRFIVADTSMQPGLRPGDRLLVVGWLRPRVGDIVVLRDPEAHNTVLLKRIDHFTADGMAVVVRGDNPYVSRDSRHFGAVPKKLILGRVVYRYLRAGL